MANDDEATSSNEPLLPQEEPRQQPLPPREPLPPPRYGELITVLSIDGGGIRGLIPAVVLNCLEEKLKIVEMEVNHTNENVQIADYFDVVAGTSTGGLIAAMLVTPGENDRPLYTPKRIEEFYRRNGPKIFPSRWWWPGPLSMCWGPKYNGTFLQDEIKRQVGATVNGQKMTLDKTLCKIVIPTFDVHRMEPVIFSSYEVPPENGEEKPELSNVCIGTSAAPTFFPACHFNAVYIDPNKTERSQFDLIDGGVAANNPTMAAISRVTREQLTNNKDFHPCHPNGVDYKKYLVISVGTGTDEAVKGAYTAKSCAKWGALRWVYNWSNSHNPIIDIFSEASAVLVDLHVRFLLYNTHKTVDKQNYLRIQAQGLFLPMDTATTESMNHLVNIGKNLLDKDMAMVDLTSGKYETFEGQNGQKVPSNSDELERFARSLVHERNLRLSNQKIKKGKGPDADHQTKGTHSSSMSPAENTFGDLKTPFEHNPDEPFEFDPETQYYDRTPPPQPENADAFEVDIQKYKKKKERTM